MKKILILTDNIQIYNEFKVIADSSPYVFDYYCSTDAMPLKIINVKDECQKIIDYNYDLIISLHCKQIFPATLFNNIRCINVHPGFNPYNRGWYPQVFAIINKKKMGVTIHEIDAKIDHGPIIFQEEIEVHQYDTSLSVYNRVIELEIKMLKKHLDDIVNGNYIATHICSEGNLNYQHDFLNLCKLDLNEKLTMGDAIDRLRALTHGGYQNAYFYDKNGNKIFIRLLIYVQ